MTEQFRVDRERLVSELITAIEGGRPGPEWMTIKEIHAEVVKSRPGYSMDKIRKKLPKMVEAGVMEKVMVDGSHYYRWVGERAEMPERA